MRVQSAISEILHWCQGFWLRASTVIYIALSAPLWWWVLVDSVIGSIINEETHPWVGLWGHFLGLLTKLGILSPRVASISGGTGRNLKQKAILLVHLFLLLASELLCPLPFPDAAAANDEEEGEGEDDNDGTFFHFFLWHQNHFFGLPDCTEDQKISRNPLSLQLGWDYLDIEPSGFISYQALSLSKVKTAISAHSHTI